MAAALAPIVRAGGLAGIDTPARYLPSIATQRARQAALPGPADLRARLDKAVDGLPFRPNLFEPFLAAVETARLRQPIGRADLDGSALGLKVDSLLLRQPDGWTALLALRGVAAPDLVARVVANEPGAVMVNIKGEADRLLGVYLREGVSLAALGAVGISLLLLLSLRSWRRLARMMAPLAAAVVVTLAILRLGGHALSIFNLFGVLLVVAIGSNYTLFFDRSADEPSGTARVLASLLLANFATVAGFGILGLSGTPVLHDLGMPVAIGTFLSLLFAMVLMPPARVPDASQR
jgi:predicted exporter